MKVIQEIRIARRREEGVVLFISLIFLLVMTMIGVTAMSGAGMQERMAGNLRDKELSFEAAEAALRDAETTELSSATLQPFNNSSGRYVVTATVGQQRFDAGNWNAAAWKNSGNTLEYSKPLNVLEHVVERPRYYIEQLPPVKDTHNSSMVMGHEYGEKTKTYHRITARGAGQTQTAITILQSTYLRD